jgi:hypothetical protein
MRRFKRLIIATMAVSALAAGTAVPLAFAATTSAAPVASGPGMGYWG